MTGELTAQQIALQIGNSRVAGSKRITSAEVPNPNAFSLLGKRQSGAVDLTAHSGVFNHTPIGNIVISHLAGERNRALGEVAVVEFRAQIAGVKSGRISGLNIWLRKICYRGLKMNLRAPARERRLER